MAGGKREAGEKQECLVALIQKLGDKIERQSNLLRESETLTRYALIDPFLRELGWDIEDPEEVRPDYEHGTYYALLAGHRVVFLIAPSKLDSRLTQHLPQGIQYCATQAVPYFVATDGRRWEVYDTRKAGSIHEKRVVSIDICNDSPEGAAFNSLFLWRNNLDTAPALSTEPRPSPELSSLSPDHLRALPDGLCLIHTSEVQNEDFLRRYRAWGPTGQPRKNPAYLALYIGAPVSAIKYLGEIEDVLNPEHPSSPIRDEYTKFTPYKAGRKVITFQRLWELERVIPKGKAGLAWPSYCFLKDLAEASDLDDLLPGK